MITIQTIEVPNRKYKLYYYDKAFWIPIADILKALNLDSRNSLRNKLSNNYESSKKIEIFRRDGAWFLVDSLGQCSLVKGKVGIAGNKHVLLRLDNQTAIKKIVGAKAGLQELLDDMNIVKKARIADLRKGIFPKTFIEKETAISKLATIEPKTDIDKLLTTEEAPKTIVDEGFFPAEEDTSQKEIVEHLENNNSAIERMSHDIKVLSLNIDKLIAEIATMKKKETRQEEISIIDLDENRARSWANYEVQEIARHILQTKKLKDIRTFDDAVKTVWHMVYSYIEGKTNTLVQSIVDRYRDQVTGKRPIKLDALCRDRIIRRHMINGIIEIAKKNGLTVVSYTAERRGA